MVTCGWLLDADGLPVHPELGGDPIEAQRHQRHVWDAFSGRGAFLYGGLQEAKVHLHTQLHTVTKHILDTLSSGSKVTPLGWRRWPGAPLS